MLAKILDLAIIGVICLLFLIVALIALMRWSKRIKQSKASDLLDLERELEKMQREVPNFAAALVILDIAVGIIFRDKISLMLIGSMGVVNIVYLIVLLAGVVGWRGMSKRWQRIQEQLPIQEIRAQMSMQAQVSEQDMVFQQQWQALPAPAQWQDGQTAFPGQQALPAPAQWQGEQIMMPGQQNQWQDNSASPWQQGASGQNW